MVRVLADLGIVKELNEGIKRIYADMENYFPEAPEKSEKRQIQVLDCILNGAATAQSPQIIPVKPGIP